MNTFLELSCYTLILCLILGITEWFTTLFDERGWRTHLSDFFLLVVVWAGYVWLSNLFSSRIIHLDEYDIINMLAIALVVVSVLLFGVKNDDSSHP